jgi:hypothetical protein
MMILIETYFAFLQKDSIENFDEHSLRTALENLFNAMIVENKILKEITVLQESKRADKFGTTDFKISNMAGAVGYKVSEKYLKDRKGINRFLAKVLIFSLSEGEGKG